MHWFWGIIVGFLIYILGIPVLQFINAKLGIYDDLTLSQGCYVVIMILLCVIAFKRVPVVRRRRVERREE